MKKTNLINKQDVYISTLSEEEKQRTGIAQALIGNPKILFFDEPTTQISKEEMTNFYKLISQSAKEKLILLSIDSIENMEFICDELIVISEGRILFNRNPILSLKLIFFIFQHHIQMPL